MIDHLYNKEGLSVYEIAHQVGMHETSIYRELNRGMTKEINPVTGRFVYDSAKARFDAAIARSKRGRKKVINCDKRQADDIGKL